MSILPHPTEDSSAHASRRVALHLGERDTAQHGKQGKAVSSSTLGGFYAD